MTSEEAVQRAYARFMKTKSGGGRYPYDTGNMHNQATSMTGRRTRTGYEWNITIDSKIAPYVVYTNEPWISPRWHGRKNPNEKWIDRSVKDMAKSIAKDLGGMVE